MARKSLTRRQRAAAAAFAMVPVSVLGLIFLLHHQIIPAFGIEIGAALLYFLWVRRGKPDEPNEE